MVSNSKKIIFLLAFSSIIFSCRTANISNYYFKNQQVLGSIKGTYIQQYKNKPFSIEFTDKLFNHVSIEFITDSIKYIYEFEIKESRIKDTLIKYNLQSGEVQRIIAQMKSIHCIWINNLDYYTDNKKKQLVFISIKSKPLILPFNNKKYFIITYFSQPQYFDAEGRLLDKRHLHKLRKINEDIFKRINDKVAYTISDRYR